MSALFIVRHRDVYVSVEPSADADAKFCIDFAWTNVKAEAVRFSTHWHARAVAKALRAEGMSACVIEVKS